MTRYFAERPEAVLQWEFAKRDPVSPSGDNCGIIIRAKPTKWHEVRGGFTRFALNVPVGTFLIRSNYFARAGTGGNC